jgi:hypothetical protein
VPVLDSRHLLFDSDALRLAMRDDNRVARLLALPSSPDDKIFVLPDEQCIEVMHIPSDQKAASGPHLAQPIIHRLSAQQVAALLIAYCIKTGIPVPRNCKKSIVMHQDQISLNFSKRIGVAAQ